MYLLSDASKTERILPLIRYGDSSGASVGRRVQFFRGRLSPTSLPVLRDLLLEHPELPGQLVDDLMGTFRMGLQRPL